MNMGVEYRCPLCGKAFASSRDSCSGVCPLSRRCNLVCCPHCGYSFPRESRIYTFFKGLFKKFSGANQKNGNPERRVAPVSRKGKSRDPFPVSSGKV